MDLQFTQADLKSAIPAHCFKPSVWRSLAYPLFDIAVIAGAYWALSLTNAWYFELPLIFLIGTMVWSLFVIAHEAGHGAFSRSRTLNTCVGIALNAPALVPYRPWQRSHLAHHTKTGHLQEEEVFRACRAEQDWFARKVLFRSGVFLLIGWPMYLLGYRNITTYDPVKGSHFLPVSDLYSKHIRWSWYASVLAVAAFLALYIGLGVTFGLVFALKYIVAPYFIFAVWLTLVTYMQHVAPETPVYDTEDWTYLKGALATVDRSYGPFNWLTHHIGNTHVLHHIFPTIPHYHAEQATRAIRPVLGDAYLKSDRFVLFDLIRTLIGCHYVEPGEGHEVWKSAYGFAANSGEAHKAASIIPAE